MNCNSCLDYCLLARLSTFQEVMRCFLGLGNQSASVKVRERSWFCPNIKGQLVLPPSLSHRPLFRCLTETTIISFNQPLLVLTYNQHYET